MIAPLNRPSKTSRWGQISSPDDYRSTGPVDRQRSDFLPLEPRSTGPVDRGLDTESSLSVRSTARSTGAFPESRALWTVDRPGRPALQPDWRARLCTSVDRLSRPTPSSVDQSGRPAEARTGLFRDLKLGFLS